MIATDFMFKTVISPRVHFKLYGLICLKVFYYTNGHYDKHLNSTNLLLKLPKLNNHSSEIIKIEWNAYLIWYFKASKCYQEAKMDSLQNN